MRAKVTQEFNGAPDGEFHPRMIAVGEEVSGELAEAAVGAGWASPLDGSKSTQPSRDKAIPAAPRNKAK